MELNLLAQRSEYEWEIPQHGRMRVPAVICADETLIREMDRKVYDQAVNVATLPGIVRASYAMPDAHWGYGFAVGGVAAFDPDAGGVISAGGVGFDISCGVRCLHTGLIRDDILKGSSARGQRGAWDRSLISIKAAIAAGVTINRRQMAAPPKQQDRRYNMVATNTATKGRRNAGNGKAGTAWQAVAEAVRSGQAQPASAARATAKAVRRIAKSGVKQTGIAAGTIARAAEAVLVSTMEETANAARAARESAKELEKSVREAVKAIRMTFRQRALAAIDKVSGENRRTPLKKAKPKQRRARSKPNAGKARQTRRATSK